ncbi:TATA-binding protein-associated factor BTAF1 [Vitis vinifera]|uniref:TATA-binding protein-associated factor BTAF1 n=1 Tax=Vitis vinifera TaxID=29760 RepID=A0A438GZ61_VITVI|nr:TATA-binding protein-associated factor BTAF1 [Vitis vinifera]
MEELVEILGCRVGSLPSRYLGLCLGAVFKSTIVETWWKRGCIKGCKVEETIPVQGVVLFRATLMDAWVCDAWEQANNGDKARFPKEWELDSIGALLLCLQGKSVSREVEDKAMWMVRKEGKFSVKSFYGGMAQGFKFVPDKVYLEFLGFNKSKVFCLGASWRGILTLDKLKRRGWMLVLLQVLNPEPANQRFRVAAAHAIGAIAENVKHSSLSELFACVGKRMSEAGISGEVEDVVAWPDYHPKIMAGSPFRSFDINKVLEFGALLASGGQGPFNYTLLAFYLLCCITCLSLSKLGCHEKDLDPPEEFCEVSNANQQGGGLHHETFLGLNLNCLGTSYLRLFKSYQDQG